MMVDAHERSYKFVLLNPEWWDAAEVKFVQTAGKLVLSASYHDTWSLSKTPGGYRYYAWKRAWAQGRVPALKERYLQADELPGLLELIQEVIG